MTEPKVATNDVVDGKVVDGEKAKVVICANKEKYQKSRTSTGKTSMNCGDAVALAFAGLSVSQKYACVLK